MCYCESNMNPLISIIVPIYNAESTLNRCIDSIINQSFDDWELLLIDDGSKDQSGKICDEYATKDSRIKVFHKENGGVSSARNLGLDNALGKWITFIDSDDKIFDDIFSLLKYLEGDLVVFNFIISGYPQNLFEENMLYYNGQMKLVLEQYLHSLIFRVPWGKFYRRNLIDSLRFDANIRIGEDTLFVLSYLNKCSSILLRREVYYDWDDLNIDYGVKYALKVDNAIYIIANIYQAYRVLNIESIPFLQFIFLFFRGLCEKDFYGKEYIWFGNANVISLWNKVRINLSFRDNILIYCKRYRFFCFLLKIYHFIFCH